MKWYKLKSNFFLKKRKFKREGYNFVKWKDLIVEEDMGVWELKTWKSKNHSKALRMKWLWKYVINKQMLWGKVIDAKYEEEDRWMTKEVTASYVVDLWRSDLYGVNSK